MASKLSAGQRLNINDRLVSTSGRYILLMQTDGNLVLYQDAVAAGHAYWATNTWTLPQAQRPTYVSMQPDANFVLYDASQTARWASGTWGPRFIEPFIELQDDGNLVVKHSGVIVIWASGVVGGGQSIGSKGLIGNPDDINYAVDNCGRMPTIVTGSTNLAPPTTSSVDVTGVAYSITEQRRRIVNDVVEHAFLQDLTEVGVWPGAAIQGAGLLKGDISMIGPVARASGTIEVTTDIVTSTPHRQSAQIANPTADQVNQARRDILQALNPGDSPGQIKIDIEKADTFGEVGVKLGLSVKGSAFGIDANATLNETHKQSSVVASIRQVFYNVTFTPSSAQAAGIWSAGQVSPANLQPFMGPGNPPLYVDSVQYGRFICVTAQASFSSQDIGAALKAHWQASVSGSVDVDAHTKNVLENSTIKIYTIGVPGHGGFQDLGDPITDLANVYKNGLSLSSSNPGAPISFTCRHIADGTLAHVGLAAEYTEPLSAVGGNITQQPFEVWDGPGGGLVDTGISVNPGDTVTISASGMIWTGVFLSGDTGPEGWPGHKADEAAPLPGSKQGTAYSLIAQFGNDPDWKEVGRFWQGSPDPGKNGRLLLNENDNNPYNGDRNKHWKVLVDVARASAEAAGIYV